MGKRRVHGTGLVAHASLAAESVQGQDALTLEVWYQRVSRVLLPKLNKLYEEYGERGPVPGEVLFHVLVQLAPGKEDASPILEMRRADHRSVWVRVSLEASPTKAGEHLAKRLLLRRRILAWRQTGAAPETYPVSPDEQKGTHRAPEEARPTKRRWRQSEPLENQIREDCSIIILRNAGVGPNRMLAVLRNLGSRSVSSSWGDSRMTRARLTKQDRALKIRTHERLKKRLRDLRALYPHLVRPPNASPARWEGW